jgi:hypothetical protein
LSNNLLYDFVDYTIRTFGAEAGSKAYNLGKKDLKRSLASLILEINKNAKDVEASVTDLL